MWLRRLEVLFAVLALIIIAIVIVNLTGQAHG